MIKKNNKSDSNEVLVNLIYFLQRMGQTQGIKNVSLISGNISTQRDFIKYVENLKNKIIPSNYNTEEKNFSDLI